MAQHSADKGGGLTADGGGVGAQAGRGEGGGLTADGGGAFIHLADEAATAALGGRLARALGGRGAVHLHGHLGAGKTTLCRAVLRALGHKGAVKSPTFTLVEPYELGGRQVFHLDLYRLSDAHELDYLGIEDYFGDDCISLVEWPERAAGRLPQHDLSLRLAGRGGARQASVQGASSHGEKVCLALQRHYGMA